MDSNQSILKAKQNNTSRSSICYCLLGPSSLLFYLFLKLISYIIIPKAQKYAQNKLARVTKLEEQEAVLDMYERCGVNGNFQPDLLA